MQLYYFSQAGKKNGSKFFKKSKQKSVSRDIPALLGKVRILIVDDQPEFLEALSRRLKRRNIDFVAVKSGFEAIEAAEKEKFDLILLDVKMPDMNGVETYRRLMASIRTCPIIFMSAHYEEYAKDIERLSPFILKKPFDFSELEDFILKICGVPNEDGGAPGH